MSLALWWAPIRRIGDVRGRSSRGELVRWLVLAMALTVLADVVSAASPARAQTQLAASVLLLIPTVPLAIRRVHDVGWSGWWLLLAAPLVASNLSILAQRVAGGAADPATAPGWVPPDALPVLIGLLLGVAVLLFWNDQAGPNRFGPNPRDGAPAT